MMPRLLETRDEKSGEFVIEDSVTCDALEMIQCHGKEPELERGHLETRISPLNGLVVPVPGRPNVMRADKYWRSRDWGRVVLTIVTPGGGPGEDATMVTSVMAMSQHQVVLLSSVSHSHLSTCLSNTSQLMFQTRCSRCSTLPYFVAGMFEHFVKQTKGQICGNIAHVFCD